MWNGIKEPLIRGKTGRKEVMILLFIAETLGENYYVLDTVLGLENTKERGLGESRRAPRRRQSLKRN